MYLYRNICYENDHDDESGGDDSQSMDQDGEAAGMAADDSTEIDADSEMDGMTDGESPGGGFVSPNYTRRTNVGRTHLATARPGEAAR